MLFLSSYNIFCHHINANFLKVEIFLVEMGMLGGEWW